MMANMADAGPAALLDEARQRIGQDILGGATAAGALAHFTAYVDRETRRFAANGPAPPAALIALGGYGRKHLCPYSDIDLLIVFEGAVGGAEEKFLRDLLHPLWDAGFVVGHQVREQAELAEPETGNPEFMIALTDARFVAGDESVFGRANEAIHSSRARALTIDALSTLIDARYAAFGGTLYQLEPDVKESPGGLRDVAAIRAIVRLTDPALLLRGSEDERRLAQAEEFLLRVRALLHLARRRNDNTLRHEVQEAIAASLGYRGPSPGQQVEGLMADYFRHARVVARTLERVRRTAPTPVGVNLGRTRDGIRFIDERQAASHPATWMGAFAAAVDTGAHVADETLDLIRRNVPRCSVSDLVPAAEDRAALLRFLRPRPGLYARLSEMHDCGLLGRLLPPFAAITHRVVRDFYHKYTVDEHTLQAVRNLERLTDPEPPQPRFAALMRETDAPELLVLALLLHDVGKWRDGDHEVESVRLAEELLDGLALPGPTRETVLFLIRHHLAMSQVAFRRDTEDPEIVRDFARLVGTEDRLKQLCLITLADVAAVSPDTLTKWKEELLWRLYVDAYRYATVEYGDDLIDRTQAAVAECIARRPPDLGAAEVAAFLEGLPRRYLQLFERRTVYEHVRLARDIHPDQVHMRLTADEAAWELTVVTLDKPMLFANICGVLSSFGMDILRGHAMTSTSGLVLDVFQFSDGERFLAANANASEVILHAIEDVVAGRSTAADRLRGRRHGLARRRPLAGVAPIVRVDGHASRRYTVLEIVAPDEPGLLYRISHGIAAGGCAIDLVLIATEGHRAVDVFHITKNGAKLTEADQDVVAANLQRLLDEDKGENKERNKEESE
jgi:[protein-PII] uridylyltransferase